jgi:hypothetical protein
MTRKQVADSLPVWAMTTRIRTGGSPGHLSRTQ